MKKTIENIIGIRYGKLVVLEYSKTTYKCLCKCDCGKTKEIAKNSLIKGLTKSCGCLRTDMQLKRHKQLINTKVGKLLIKDIVFDNNDYYAKCLCDCGKLTNVQLTHLTQSNPTTSCGCNRFKNKLNYRFGKLVVIKFAERKNNTTYWLCKCDCGREKVIRDSCLNSGGTTSCGCSLVCRKFSNGKRDLSVYNSYRQMISRCYNSKNAKYIIYGARGITVCDEWLGENGFENFYNWAIKNGYIVQPKNTPYKDKLSIERKNVNGNYCPENCTWIPMSKQGNNTRCNHLITYNGETKNIKEWSIITGINYKALHNRLVYSKWSVEKSFTTPVRQCNR